MTLLLVFLGGGLGAVARHLAGLAATASFGVAFPWGTLLVNVTGCLVMGILAKALPAAGADWRLFLMTGILGGYTTFSAFGLDTLTLIERGDTGAALGYVAASVTLSLAAVALGLAIGHMLAR